MVAQNGIQWKLDRLKDTIAKSGNVENDVKYLLRKVTINDVGAEVSRLSKNQAIQLYQARYHLLQQMGKDNKSFVSLLKRLEEVDNDLHLVITVLRLKDDSYIVFTNKNYDKCFGIIYDSG